MSILSIWSRAQSDLTNGKTPDDVAIRKPQAAVNHTPAGNSDMPERRIELVRLFIRSFERKGTLCDLNEAIRNQQVAVDLTPAGDHDKPKRLRELASFLMRRFERQGMPDDLQGAIKNQQAAVHHTLAGDPDMPERLSELARLLMCSSECKRTLGDLNEATKNQQAVEDLTPAVRALADYKRFPVYAHSVGTFIIFPLAPVTVPTMLGGGNGNLIEDLQQLSLCIKKPKHRELATTLRHMENAILCLKFQDGDELCENIFRASTRLGAYCQALRNRAEDEPNQKELEDLYKEFVRIEREFSAAHDRISSKYEQLYKQWKAERQSLSKFLSKADSAKSQIDNPEIWALVEQVDAGFEKIGNVLKREANDLKNFSETLNGLSKLVHLPPDPPITSNDPVQIPPQPPDYPPTPSEVSTQVDDVVTTLSQVDALVEKSRYTKARQIVSETSFKTTKKLKKLRASSEEYEEESRSLSSLPTRHHNDHSRDTRNPQRGL